MATAGERGDCEVKRGGEKRKRGEEIGERKKKRSGGEKRKREEESQEMKKMMRGEEARVLEDEEPRAGSSQDPVTSSPYPKFTIKQLTIHRELGRGVYGKVVLASVPGRNNLVAVKVIDKRGDNAAILMRERRILQTVRDCPFICHLYATRQSLGQVYYISEYLSGGSLKALIRMCRYLDTNNVRFYTAEIACGLQFLHRQNIVHRDIKPDNILLAGDGHVRIVDLGLAQDGVTSSNKTSGVTGTFVYMAPEVFLRQDYYTAVDWFSLGIVVCMMSAGQSPFYFGPGIREAYRSITRDKPVIPSWLEADLQHLIEGLLCKNPEERLGVSKNIRDHPFFATVHWEELEQGRAQPPFIPFKAVLENEHLQWPEDKTSLDPVAGFSFTAPSWAREDPPM